MKIRKWKFQWCTDSLSQNKESRDHANLYKLKSVHCAKPHNQNVTNCTREYFLEHTDSVARNITEETHTLYMRFESEQCLLVANYVVNYLHLFAAMIFANNKLTHEAVAMAWFCHLHCNFFNVVEEVECTSTQNAYFIWYPKNRSSKRNCLLYNNRLIWTMNFNLPNKQLVSASPFQQRNSWV